MGLWGTLVSQPSLMDKFRERSQLVQIKWTGPEVLYPGLTSGLHGYVLTLVHT